MDLPFPVDGTYRIRADVEQLARRRRRHPGEGGVVVAGSDDADVLLAKLDALERGEHRVRAWADDVDERAVGVAVDALLQAGAEATGGALAWDGERLASARTGVRIPLDFARLTAGAPAAGRGPLGKAVATHLREVYGRDRLLDAVALALGEDLVLVDGRGAGRLELLHVCQPSGWSASDKVGRSFASTHGPVPESDALRARGPELATMIAQRGPLVRYAWGLHRDGARCHDPHVHAQPDEPVNPSPAEAAAATWFRVERQTTLPVPEVDRGWFLIRVWTAPLAEAVTTPARAASLAASLRAMSDEVAAYKGVTRRRPALLAWLDARATGAGFSVESDERRC